MTLSERKPRKEDELRTAANNLYYEFWMFVKLANGLAAGIVGESVLNNSLLESFASHSKAVLDFLYNDDANEDDVVAGDYLRSPEDWVYERPKISKLLQQVRADVKSRVDTEIASFTYNRPAGGAARKPWPYMQVAKEVTATLDVFLEIVPPHLVGPRWQEVKQQRQQQNGAA